MLHSLFDRCLVGIAALGALLTIHDGNARADDEAKRMKLLDTFRAEFVAVTPGRGKFPKSFRMGTNDGPESDGPAHTVTLSRDFAIAKYEVPQNLYEAVMGSNPSRWKGPRNSVEMMTWAEANTFCEKVTTAMRKAKLIGEDEEIRLPTEAEWEFCCRAGSVTKYSFGAKARKVGDGDKQASLLDPYGWHTGNAAGNDPPVGALKPNPWGLYDVHGYLWEFTADGWYADHTDAPTDGTARPLAKAGDPKRVIRGGSWRNQYDRLTSASRSGFGADKRSDAVGFRCVRAKVVGKTDTRR